MGTSVAWGVGDCACGVSGTDRARDVGVGTEGQQQGLVTVGWE